MNRNYCYLSAVRCCCTSSSGKPLIVWIRDTIKDISLKSFMVTENKITIINNAQVPLKET